MPHVHGGRPGVDRVPRPGGPADGPRGPRRRGRRRQRRPGDGADRRGQAPHRDERRHHPGRPGARLPPHGGAEGARRRRGPGVPPRDVRHRRPGGDEGRLHGRLGAPQGGPALPLPQPRRARRLARAPLRARRRRVQAQPAGRGADARDRELPPRPPGGPRVRALRIRHGPRAGRRQPLDARRIRGAPVGVHRGFHPACRARGWSGRSPWTWGLGT